MHTAILKLRTRGKEGGAKGKARWMDGWMDGWMDSIRLIRLIRFDRREEGGKRGVQGRGCRSERRDAGGAEDTQRRSASRQGGGGEGKEEGLRLIASAVHFQTTRPPALHVKSFTPSRDLWRRTHPFEAILSAKFWPITASPYIPMSHSPVLGGSSAAAIFRWQRRRYRARAKIIRYSLGSSSKTAHPIWGFSGIENRGLF